MDNKKIWLKKLNSNGTYDFWGDLSLNAKFNFVIMYESRPNKYPLQPGSFWKQNQNDYILSLQQGEEIEQLICMCLWGGIKPKDLNIPRMVYCHKELKLYRFLIEKYVKLTNSQFKHWVNSNYRRLLKTMCENTRKNSTMTFPSIAKEDFFNFMQNEIFQICKTLRIDYYSLKKEYNHENTPRNCSGLSENIK